MSPSWHGVYVVFFLPRGLRYTVLCSETFDYSEGQVDEQYWVVTRRLSEQTFEKTLAFRLPGFEEVKRLYDLGVASEAEVALA